jgi:multidrug efflux system membrane fusion protein
MDTRNLLHYPMLALAIALVILLVAGCGQPQAQNAAPPPPPVSVAAAIEKPVVQTDEFPGRIEAVESVVVRSRVNGTIDSVHFKPGATVRKGELLFVIDPRPFQAEVARAEATLGTSRAQLDLARTELARNELLLAERATSRREYDDAAAKVRQLEAQIKALQASLDIARLNLAYTRIASPIDGRVGKAEITVGNLVQGEGPSSPTLTTVVSTNPVYASFEADEATYLKYIAAARSGLSVAVALADEQGFPHAGRLEFVDNRVDPQSGTVRMRALLANGNGRFAPGLFARIRIGDSAAPRKAVVVADRAIGTDQSKRFVLVVDADNKAQYREVRIGRLVDGGLRVVESGLEAGEVIVVNGLQRVRPGAPVTPQPVVMAAKS